MDCANNGLIPQIRGVQIAGPTSRAIDWATSRFVTQLEQLGLAQWVETVAGPPASNLVGFQLKDEIATELAPDGDTTSLCEKLNLETGSNPTDLEREILLCMLVCPIPLQFPSYDELAAAVRIRRNVVIAARKTSLTFATDEAERPAEFWTWDDDRGFVVNPGKSLITALERATQPDPAGRRYTFSCRRAGEYVVLLAIATEVRDGHQALFNDLQLQAETRAVKGREFESIFQHQVGTRQNPLPLRFFIPGDRTWFRNPEPISAEITGYEGSWTFYLGNGIFADFWRPRMAYSLTTKCLSIYHWRNSTYRDAEGQLQIDERQVETHVEQTLQDADATRDILQQMIQLQEPLDVIGGGCIEAHREHVRLVCPGTADLHLPDIPATIAAEKVVGSG